MDLVLQDVVKAFEVASMHTTAYPDQPWFHLVIGTF